MTAQELNGIKVPTVNNESELLRLAAMDKTTYLRERKAAAERLHIPESTLDKQVEVARNETEAHHKPGSTALLVRFDPWPDEVGGIELLDELVAQVLRFVAIEEHQAQTVAGWILFAHCFEAFEISPRLFVTSPEKRCGKSTLLQVLHKLVPKPLFAGNASPSAMFRLADADQPTIILDEVDGYVKGSEDFRNIINAGHAVDNCHVIRNVGEGTKMKPAVFRVWCPVALGGIGCLQGTIEDRSIIIKMRRRKPCEKVDKARRRLLKELEPLARKAARWASDHVDALKDFEPTVPDELNDRAADNWEPLLAIGEIIGGPWPERLRGASIRLSVVERADEEGSAGAMLLSDCWQVFKMKKADRLFSTDLVEALTNMEDRPWVEWRRGHPITANGIAKILKQYDILPGTIRVGTKTAKGYYQSKFREPYERYCHDNTTVNVQDAPESQRHNVTNGLESPDIAVSETSHARSALRPEIDQKSQKPKGCDHVTPAGPSHCSFSAGPTIPEPAERASGWKETL